MSVWCVSDSEHVNRSGGMQAEVERRHKRDKAAQCIQRRRWSDALSRAMKRAPGT